MVSSGQISDELEHLHPNYVPRDELNRAITSLDQANCLLEGAQCELEAEKKRSQGKLADLRMRVDKVKAQLTNSEFFVEEFEKIVKYVNMQNATMESGVSWSLRQLSNENPWVNYFVLHECFRVKCNVADDIDDEDNE